MIPVPGGVRVWLATGHTDMRKGMHGLALQVQQGSRRDPHAGDLYIFRGRTGGLVKILWHDGLGTSLYAKRLDRGRFVSYGLCQGLQACAGAHLRWCYFGLNHDPYGRGRREVSTVAQTPMRGLVTP